MGYFDGFIDQYMLDEYGPEYVDPAALRTHMQNTNAAQESLNAPVELKDVAAAEQAFQNMTANQATGQNWGSPTNHGYAHGNLPEKPRRPGMIENLLFKGWPSKQYAAELKDYNAQVNQHNRARMLQDIRNNPDMSRQELALRLIEGTDTSREVGYNMLQDLLKPQAKTDYDRFLDNPDVYQQWKAAGRAPDKGTTLQQNLAAAGYQPGTPEYQAAMQQAIMKPQTQVNLGNVPAGSERVVSPTTNRAVLRPQLGSKDYTNASEGYLTVGQGIGEVDQMLKMIDKHGTEAFGPQSGVYENLYGQLLSRVAEAQNKGVLQQGETEMIMKGLPNPGDPLSAFTTNDRIKASYNQLRKTLAQKQRILGQKFKDWGYDLPKVEGEPDTGWTAEDEAEFQRLHKKYGGK